MNYDSGNPHNLAYSSRCTPGSEAEQKEKQRIEEFLQAKATREAEAQATQPETTARREEAYQRASEANRARMRENKAARTTYGKVTLPRPEQIAAVQQEVEPKED